MTPPKNDAVPRGGGAGVNGQVLSVDPSPPLPVPDGVPDWAWAKIARPEGDRWAIRERDADGEVIGTAYRDAEGHKTFAPGGKRGLIVAWRLGAYAGTSAAQPIFVTEGASDAAALLGLGLDAVGVPMAGHCGPMLAELLAGRHAVIVADADDAGRRGARKIAEALLRRCASVRVIEPPGGAKDARAAVIAGADRAAFLALASGAETIQPEREPIDGAPVVVRLSDVEPEPVAWLWPGRIALGTLTMLVGRPGDGKSFATADWAARVTNGWAWPDGAPGMPGSVLLIAGEDDPARVIRPRLDAHGADPARVHLLRGVQSIDDRQVAREVGFTLADLSALEQSLDAIPDAALVVIDPIGSFIGGRVDAHRDNEVRAVLHPLAMLAQRRSVAVVLVAHQRKGAAAHADDLLLGSRAFSGIARSVLHLLRDPDDEERRLLLPGKSNLCRPAAGLAFRIDGEPARLEWERAPVDLTADGVVGALASGDSGGRTERDDAADWLQAFLADGPRPAREVEHEAREAGYSLATLRRAKAAIGVLSRKPDFDGPWEWCLPSQDAHEPPKALTPQSVSAFDDGERLGSTTANAAGGWGRA